MSTDCLMERDVQPLGQSFGLLCSHWHGPGEPLTLLVDKASRHETGAASIHLRRLVNRIDAMGPYTSGHSERVALVARRLAEQMHCDAAFCQRAYFGGLLHDIGKITIPGAILRKPTTLTPEEFDLIRQHPISGARLIGRIHAMQDVVPAVIGHHEWMDGTGYPAGVPAGELNPLARLVAVADCFDAMTSQRAYRPGKSIESARRELASIAGRHLDGEMVQALLSMDLDQLHRDLGTYHSGLRGTAATVMSTE